MRLVLPALLWCALAAPALAGAPSTPAEIEARGIELFENGAILYDEGRYEDAILAWQEGYRISQRPGFLYNIANAQERLGDYAAAIDTLGRYRALARTDERETLDRRIRNLEERLASAPRPAPNGPSAGGPPPPAGGRPPRADPRGPSARPLVGGSLVALGAVGLTSGTVFGLQSRAAGEQAQATCRTGGAGLLCPGEAAASVQANRRKALLADLGFGAGALAGAGGVLLLLTGPQGKAVSVAPTGHGMRVQVTLP